MSTPHAQPLALPGRFICLLYHDVYRGELFDYGRIGGSATRFHVAERAFKVHLELVSRSGMCTLDVEAARRSLSASSTLGARRGVVMCFDDGWAGAVRYAAPLLRQRGIPAFFFVTTAFLGRTFFVTPQELRQLDPLFFTIGSHGSTHRMLSSLSTDQIRAELVESKRRLEEILGRPVTCLSVPGGAVDSRVVDIAQEVGYSEVFTSAIGVNPTRHGRFGIARVAVTKATSAEMVARWLLFRLGRERLRKAILAVPKKILGMSTYSNLRRVLMGEAVGYDHLFEP